MVRNLAKHNLNSQGLLDCRVFPFAVAAPSLAQHVSATSGTKWTQDRIQAALHAFLGNHFLCNIWNQVGPRQDPSRWVQDRIQAALIAFLGNHLFFNIWNQVDPRQDPSRLYCIPRKSLFLQHLEPSGSKTGSKPPLPHF